MLELIWWLGPILAGWGMMWLAGKCRGRNARNAFRFAAWGFWLVLLRLLAPLLGPGFLMPITWLLLLVPSGICFILAANSVLKEMRAQQRGEYTDAI